MDVKITRIPSDERFYLIDCGGSGHSAMEASGLKAWLMDVGMGDSTIAAVLDISPNETMLFTMGKKAA